MEYFGIVSKERWADNRDYYKSIIAHPEGSGLSRVEARRHLDFLGRFPPGKSHERSMTQQVLIYSIKGNVFVRRRKLFVAVLDLHNPESCLEQIAQVDVKEDVERVCKCHDFPPVLYGGIVENREHAQKPLFMPPVFHQWFLTKEKPAKNAVISNPYLNILYDSSHFNEDCSFNYTFCIIPPQSPMPVEYHIITCFAVDGLKISEKKDIARPAFEINRDTNLPAVFKRFILSRT